ncbi:MAG: hypothetical protein Q8N91_03085, partial [Candidatus Omnitrophota bacterium]|nr:hypothetical protein [Candidatus Omnitrophota bacterium]
IASIVSNPLLKAKAKNRDNVEASIKVLFADMPDEVVHNKKILKEGDLVLGGNGVVKEVLYTKTVKSGYSDAAVLLKASCVKLADELYCANMPIKINSRCTISNPVYVFTDGIIFDVDIGDKKG